MATRIATLAIVVIPFLGLVAAMALLWGRGFHWLELGLFATMYTATGLGVTLGFHRLFTHRSYDTVRPIELTLAVLGSMSAEGPLLHWCADHRRHHKHSDDERDPHSPHGFGEGVKGVVLGFWHSHMGWLFTYRGPNVQRYVPDLARDPALKRISDWFVLWVLLGLALPAVAGGLITQSWMGALMGLLWGGLARLFMVHHLTWSINSVCHLWGDRPYRSNDESRNNVLFGILAFGEGWHNNHHAFPASARHGLSWWQFDLTYLVIRGLALLGLARRIKLPSPEARRAKAVLRFDRTRPRDRVVPAEAAPALAPPAVRPRPAP
jgi:stearoyl-CoA desaturase (delta-9 desaturase)